MKAVQALLGILFLFVLSGCNNVQPAPKSEKIVIEATKQKIEPEIERTISYQDIIEKINTINTNNKTNKRVKNIVKEYRYNTSDDDSKNSAREKALNQVKVLILEEIGVFVESYLEVDKTVSDKKYHSYFKEEIKNLTAGIVKTKIIDEKFNGKTYYVKASVLVDPDSVSEGITEILKIKANKEEIIKLSSMLKSKEKDIDIRSQEVIKLQKEISSSTLLNQAKEKELEQIQKKLEKANLLLSQYRADERRIQTRLEEIKNIIRKKTNNAMQNIERGMTLLEVIEVAGSPRNQTRYTYGDLLNYGQVIVHLENGVVACITNASCELEYKCVNYKFTSSMYADKSPGCILK